MNARDVIAGMRRGVHLRVALDTLLVLLPATVALCAVAWRIAGPTPALVLAALAIVVCAAAVPIRLRRFDRGWLIVRLDAARRDLDDSSGLVFADQASLGPLQRLQRTRVGQRLTGRAPPDLRPAWSKRAIAVAWSLSALCVLAAMLWPAPRLQSTGPSIPASAQAVAGEPRLLEAMLEARPPTYTGIAASRAESLDAKAPVASTLRWTLRYAPQPGAVELVFHDGRRLALQREGEDWTASLPLQESTLYRVVPRGVTGAAQSRLHRLDAVPDQPPRVRVLVPERSLTLMAAGQRDWRLQFEVDDDHGVAARARLLVTRTEGTGENISFQDHVRVLEGRGDRRSRRFEVRLVPSDFGLQRGEDLVARLEVLDNRAPQPQRSRSASVILRWPAEPVVGADGLDGLARQVLPAYFRSQRQIIIDAEALIAERPRLAAEEFERRSDSTGVDQRLLRLRYGQFLGEESEGGRAPPTSDLPTSDLPAGDPGGAHAHDDHDDDQDDSHAPATPSPDTHDHDHAGEAGAPAAAGFGEMDDVLEAFGHTHDIPEAATLLDPQTRETLRAALREMWQSELHLRQAAPDQALPYAYRALELIKQVQQADRIYLQRVGTQLPPIDATRRLGGKREGIANRSLPTLPVARGDEALAEAWRSLDAGDAERLVASLDALQAWVDGNRDRVADPLAWIARIDEARQDPRCHDCRAALRALVWSGMPRPAGGIARRAGDDPVARRYLDALDAPGAER
ncbi:hypothetical protein [Luteimonas saliphila]|uniref:hypothetical protein n=1 Tax=Luteimonas saliphila TaxID=2804919 RepID=UPI0030809BFF